MDNYLVSDILHYCNVSLDKSGHIPPREIDFYDLTFVLSGSMIYTANGTTYTLKKDDAILLPPGTLRSRIAHLEPVKYVSFNFRLQPHTALQLPECIPNCISSDIKKLVSAFPQSHLSPYYHAKEKVANMLNYILFELLDITALQSNNEHVLRIAKYIDEHITEKMSLQSISNEIGLTKEYTAFIFKRETNRTLTDYLNERKMLLAKDLISHNEMSLTDLASYLGYDNYNYFSRLFKRYFEVSPITLKNKS